MAARKSYHDRPSYLYIGGGGGGGGEINNNPITSDTHRPFEFNESDLWNSNGVVPFEPSKKSSTNSRLSKIPTKRSSDHAPITGKSLPVSIPDWSKILGREYESNRRRESDEDDDGDNDDDERMPPHEYLARTRMASFSVHEGVGRTLKGRDLSRVRNAIWKQTGFED